MKGSYKISKNKNNSGLEVSDLENLLASDIPIALETTPFFCNILVNLYENVQLDNSTNKSEPISDTQTVLLHQHSLGHISSSHEDGIISQDEQLLTDALKMDTPNIQDNDDISNWNQSTVMSSSPQFSEPRLHSSMSSQSSLSEEISRNGLYSKTDGHLDTNSKSVQDLLLSYKNLTTNTDMYDSPLSSYSPLTEISSHISSSKVKKGKNTQKDNNNDNPSIKSNLPKGVIHECNICGKRFQRPSTLETHMNVHSGEKPFLCPFLDCNKLFNARSNMLRHLKMHFKLGKAKYLLPSGEISSKKPTAKQLTCFTHPTSNSVT